MSIINEFGLDLWAELIISNDLSNFDIFNLSLTCKFLCQLLKKERVIQYIEGNRKIHFGIYATDASSQARLVSLAWSHDSRVIAVGDGEGVILIWNANTGQGKVVLKKSQNRDVLCVAFHPQNSNLLAAGYTAQSLHLWDIEKTTVKINFQGHINKVRSLAFHPQGQFLASTGDDHTLRIWDLVTGKCEKKQSNLTDSPWQLSFTSDGKYLGLLLCQSSLLIWDFETFQVAAKIAGFGTSSFKFLPDNRSLVYMSISFPPIKFYDLQNSSERYQSTIIRKLNYPHHIDCHPHQHIIALGGEKGVEIWDFEKKKLLQESPGYVLGISFSSNGAALAVLFASFEKSWLEVWELENILFSIKD